MTKAILDLISKLDTREKKLMIDAELKPNTVGYGK